MNVCLKLCECWWMKWMHLFCSIIIRLWLKKNQQISTQKSVSANCTSASHPLCTPEPRGTPGCPSASAASSRSGRSLETCAYTQWAPPQWRGWAWRLPQRCWWLQCYWGGCRMWCGPHQGKIQCHPRVPCNGERQRRVIIAACWYIC